MIVRCENCQTEFSLEDAQVPPEGVTVRCSVCAYVFKVEATSESAETGWQIRTTDDMLFTAPDVATMMRWIEEGRLHPDDSVSRTGRNWLRLGDMAEFAHLFGAGTVDPVFKPVSGEQAEISAVDELGPPPEFGGTPETPDAAPVFAEESHTPPPVSAPATAPTSLLAKGPRTRPPGSMSAAASMTQPAGAASTAGASRASAESSWSAGGPPPSSPAAAPAGGGSKAGWVAAVAVLLGVGVVFGVPSIRNKVLNLGAPAAATGDAATGEAAPVAADAPAELESADRALASLGRKGIGKAESALQRAVDLGEVDEATFAQMRLKQAELLSARGLAAQMAASIDEERAESLQKDAAEDLDRASRILDGLGAKTPKDEHAQLVLAQVRLLEGRAPDEVSGYLPEGGAEELRLIVSASPLWTSGDEKVELEEGVLEGLAGLDSPSGLAEAALALAHLQAEDEDAARELAKRMDARASDNPVAESLLAALGLSSAAEGGDDGGDEAADDEGEEPVLEDDDPPPTKVKKPSSGGSEGGSSGGGNRLDALLDKGCSQVRSGNASNGVKTLLKAFDLAPNDLDVMACLAQGYEKMGNASSALTFYDRVLAKSPNHRVALRNGAALYAKRGSKEKALSLYKRLLKVEPNDSTAKAYVQANDPEAGKPEPAPTPGGSTGGTPAPAPTPQPTTPAPAPTGAATTGGNG